jgi:endonuclease YncB( thermonuclease family)
VKVQFGDTLVTVRLAEIDAPEKRQAYGQEATEQLAVLVAGQWVRVVYSTKDMYGRVVGRLFCGSLDVNAIMVISGYAWVYRQYSKDHGLVELEEAAQTSKSGLWKDSSPVPPWEWRRSKR